MTEWLEMTLGEALEVHHGFAFRGEHFSDTGDLIVVTPGNFTDEGGFKTKSGKEKYYDGPVPQRFLLEAGDVVVAMTEQVQGLLGSTATIPTDDKYLHNQRIGLLEVTDPDLLDLRFVYHLMNAPGVRHQLQATATGAKIRHTAPERIKQIRVAVPGVGTQKKVAGVLDALDDLIENSRRRVEVLEEEARAIYREWFVHFRYPGHEDATFVDSPLGPIPESWEVRRIGDRLTVVLGGTPSRRNTAFWTDGSVPWVVSGRVNDSRIIEPSELITEEALLRSSAKMMPVRTTVLAITGATLGQVSALEIEACANQSVVGIYDAEGIYPEYLYLWISSNIGLIISRASGSAQQHINKQSVEATEILLPSESLGHGFRGQVKPIFDLLADLLKANLLLGRSRGLLLPKLMMGQIDVSSLNLDALVEEAVA